MVYTYVTLPVALPAYPVARLTCRHFDESPSRPLLVINDGDDDEKR